MIKKYAITEIIQVIDSKDLDKNQKQTVEAALETKSKKTAKKEVIVAAVNKE